MTAVKPVWINEDVHVKLKELCRELGRSQRSVASELLLQSLSQPTALRCILNMSNITSLRLPPGVSISITGDEE